MKGNRMKDRNPPPFLIDDQRSSNENLKLQENETLIETLKTENQALQETNQVLVLHKMNLLMEVDDLKEKLRGKDKRLLDSMKARAAREQKWQEELKRQRVSMHALFEDLAKSKDREKALNKELEIAKGKRLSERPTSPALSPANLQTDSLQEVVDKLKEQQQPAGWGGLFKRNNRSLPEINPPTFETEVIFETEQVARLADKCVAPDEGIVIHQSQTPNQSTVQEESKTQDPPRDSDDEGIAVTLWPTDNNYENDQEGSDANLRENSNKELADELFKQEVGGTFAPIGAAQKIFKNAAKVIIPENNGDIPRNEAMTRGDEKEAEPEAQPESSSTPVATRTGSRLEFLRKRRRDLENLWSTPDKEKGSGGRQQRFSWRSNSTPSTAASVPKSSEKRRLRRENQSILLTDPVYASKNHGSSLNKNNHIDQNLVNLRSRSFED